MSEPAKLLVKIWGFSVSAEGIGAVIATVVIVVAFFLYLFVRH
jgi:hypothetical protein